MLNKLPLILTVALATPFTFTAAQEANDEAQQTSVQRDRSNAAAKRLIRTAEDLFEAGQTERGMKVLESLLDRFPHSESRYEAYLMMGRAMMEDGRFADALNALNHLRALELSDNELTPDQTQWLQEALFLIGRGYYETRQNSLAFPVLRKLTRDHPNSPWASQAYFYIGMCHFSQGNWQKAIESLNLVGTFISPDSPATSRIESGRRFYLKIDDEDLPVAMRLQEQVPVRVTSSNGDEEIIQTIPLTSQGLTYIGSLPTSVGNATKGNRTLEVLGGGKVTVEYIDKNTLDGQGNLPRIAEVDVVSTGQLEFTRGTFDSLSPNAFLGQPVFIRLTDSDLDQSDGADQVTVQIAVQRKKQADDLDPLVQDGAQDAFETVDTENIVLTETEPRSGIFTGQIELVDSAEAQQSGAGTGALESKVDDRIVTSYTDVRHIDGDEDKEVRSAVEVAGRLSNRPKATQFVVNDPIVRARKSLVEATAYLELTRIFNGMGLRDGANQKSDQGLELVNAAIRDSADLPLSLRTEAFRLKWELEMAQGDYPAAIATCTTFSKLFPESPLVDEALMGIGRTQLERNNFSEAIGTFNRVLKLQMSQARPEAQFLIAEATEKMNPERPELALPLYRQVAQRYPDSKFAGIALSKLIDDLIAAKNYPQAEDLLVQVFQDHPDADFLDAMLMKWVILAYRQGDLTTARDKCTQLLFDFPESRFAAQAQAVQQKIETQLNSGS